MDQSIFMFQDEGNYEQHALIRGIEPAEVERLVTAGKATKISLGDYDSFRKKAEQVHAEYQKAEIRINGSDNPLHTQDFKDYELRLAVDDYEAKTKSIQSEYEAKRGEMVAAARATAARATVRVNDADRATAEQTADRLALSIAGASNASDVSTILAKAKEDIGYLSDGQKTAMQGRIAPILTDVKSKAAEWDAKQLKTSARAMVSSVQDLRNLDLLAGKVANQIPHSVDLEFRQLKTVRGGDIRKIKGRKI